MSDLFDAFLFIFCVIGLACSICFLIKTFDNWRDKSTMPPLTLDLDHAKLQNEINQLKSFVDAHGRKLDTIKVGLDDLETSLSKVVDKCVITIGSNAAGIDARLKKLETKRKR